MDKETITRNFSRYAYTYDRYSDVQKLAALRLLRLTKGDRFSKILEIGCGTGNYTLLLREKFRNTRLKAMDISGKMIELAHKKLKDKGVEFVIADAETIDLDEDFDCITSNACFQWFTDLEKALIKYKKSLLENGIISFSIFGPYTFWELNMSLKYIFKNVSVSVSNFITEDKITQILNKNFKEVEMEESSYEESFFCLRDLLNKIKYTGIRGGGLNTKIFFTRQLLSKLEEIYLQEFRHIKATYQLFFCKALR